MARTKKDVLKPVAKAISPPCDRTDTVLMVDNTALYYDLRGAVVSSDSWRLEGNYGISDLSDTGTARARIGPEPGLEASISEAVLREWRERILRYVVKEMDDLNADILDVICTVWLSSARSPDDMTTIRADDFLRLRGLQQRGNTFSIERRRQIAERISLLANVWIDVLEREVFEEVTDEDGPRIKMTKQRVRSRAIVVSSVAEEEDEGSKTASPFAWRVRPGDVFAPFLLGPGRQLALLSQKVLAYDYHKKWLEKRLTRYLSWIWRIRQCKGDYVAPFRVQTLLDATKFAISPRNPGRDKERFEQALDTLRQDHVIAGWQYVEAHEDLVGRKAWVRNWCEWLIKIEPAQEMRAHYQSAATALAQPPRIKKVAAHIGCSSSVVAQMRDARKRLGVSQVKVAEVLGVSSMYVSMLERGTKNPSKKLKTAIESWLSRGLDVSATVSDMSMN